MGRPISWLPRLHEIRKTVGNTARSHYGRADIEELFCIQPRAASRLLEVLPVTRVGTSYLVEREALADFLTRVHEAEDVAALMDAMREEKNGISRRKLRSLVTRDYAPVSLAGLPDNLKLRPGRVIVDFTRTEELASAMLTLALILQDDGDEFARLYEMPDDEPERDEAEDDMRRLYAELEEMRVAHR